MTETSKMVGNVKIKYDWYQTDTHVVITILQKNINEPDLKIDYSPLSVSVQFNGIDEPLIINLMHEICFENAQHKLTPFKLEIKLGKAEGIKWSKLEMNEKEKEELQDAPPRPAKNWDAVVKDEATAEENTVDDLFKKIYDEGSDEVRKAMNKSFRESGGTVLSTNWREVSEGNVSIKPPEGMEWKKWD